MSGTSTMLSTSIRLAYRDASGAPLEPRILVDNKDKSSVTEGDLRKLIRDAKERRCPVGIIVAREEGQLRQADREERWGQQDGVRVLRTARHWLPRDLEVLKPVFERMRTESPPHVRGLGRDRKGTGQSCEGNRSCVRVDSQAQSTDSSASPRIPTTTSPGWRSFTSGLARSRRRSTCANQKSPDSLHCSPPMCSFRTDLCASRLASRRLRSVVAKRLHPYPAICLVCASGGVKVVSRLGGKTTADCCTPLPNQLSTCSADSSLLMSLKSCSCWRSAEFRSRPA
jgi:hypothetical protein